MPPKFEQISSEEAELPKAETTAEGPVSGVREIERAPLSTEDPNIAPELKEKAAEANFAAMRDVFRDIPDYAVFASAAMYLQGKEKQIPELLENVPRDFDATVYSEESLNRVREKLSRMPGVTLENGGQYISFANEQAKVLRGQIHLGVETGQGQEEAAVPFELFYDSRIAPKDLPREDVMGLKTLSLEGLSKQYLNNLNYEGRLKRSADSVLELLANPLMKAKVKEQLKKINDGAKAEPWLAELADDIQLTPEQIGSMYDKIDDLVSQNRTRSDPSFNEELTARLLELKGQKTKIPKRVANLETLQEVKRAA